MLALIVDDSKVVRSVTASILTELGITSHEAENGKSALEKVNNQTYNLIILDWNMPVMTGIEFLLAAKPNLETSSTKVIFCTTENQPEKIQEAISCGA